MSALQSVLGFRIDSHVGGRQGSAAGQGYPCPLDEHHTDSAGSRGRSRGFQGFSVNPMLARVQSVAPDLRIVCRRRDRRPNDELRRRRGGRSASNQHRRERSRYPACKHDCGLLARKVRPRATPSAQRKGGTRCDTCVCVFVDRLRSGAIREAARRFGGVQQAWRRFCHQCGIWTSEERGDLLSERQSGHVQVFGPVLYSHLLKLASEKADDRTADLWVPDLNLPVADMAASYTRSEAVRLEIYARAARCRSEDELDDLEDETSRRFGKLLPAARDFFAAARLRIDCRRRGIVRLDVGSEAVAATLLPGRLRKSKGRSLQRDGDRVVYVSKGREGTLRKVEEFLDLLDE
jgi:transcription-repair coupling factor (superfamily II helicase)